MGYWKELGGRTYQEVPKKEELDQKKNLLKDLEQQHIRKTVEIAINVNPKAKTEFLDMQNRLARGIEEAAKIVAECQAEYDAEEAAKPKAE